MRKPRRFTPDELAPYQWQMPLTKRKGEQLPESSESHRLPAEHAASAPQSHPLIDWAGLFGNDHPVEVEVGMGKGLFLLTTSLARPDTNFFGIEIVRKYQLYATSRFARRDLKNVKTVCADALWVFRQFIPTATVQAVHVYFPDPWWKARHKKRRVFTKGFAADAARIIRPGGHLHIATDVEEYFRVMTDIVRGLPQFRELHTETSHGSLEEAGYQTNFEQKARKKGTPIHRARYERVDAPIE